MSRCRGAIIGLTLLLTAGTAAGQQDVQPLFKSGIERVALAAVVRDARGKLVTDLTARDFELVDSGHRRPLIGVWSEPSPASMALLMDVSGSMATKLERAREASRYLMAALQAGVDEAAMFSFDTELKELRPFSTAFETGDGAWASTRAFGATSLWDAIADTASRISNRERRRALVVITDGVDSASRLTPTEVSSIASLVDVPVYIVVISSSMEDEAHDPTPVHGPLADLAAWTGGDLLVIRDTPSTLAAARQIVAELQHQYVVAFEPGANSGWHDIVLRTKKTGLSVRARSGYMVGAVKQ